MSANKKAVVEKHHRRAKKQGVDLLDLGVKITAGVDLTIAEWCAKHRVSRPTFNNYMRDGIGPVVTCAAGRVTISAAADKEWVVRFSRPTRGRPRKSEAAPDQQPTE